MKKCLSLISALLMVFSSVSMVNFSVAYEDGDAYWTGDLV